MRPATLSALLANYNHAHFLPRALDAICEQSRLPTEVLVIDDGSTDESVAVIEGFQQRYPFVRLLRNEKNRGVTFCIERLLAEASGDYLYIGAADDFVMPRFFEKSMSLLEQHPQAGLCCAYMSTMDGETEEISENPSGWCDRPSYLSPASFAEVCKGAGIPGHSTIAKLSALKEAGSYLHELRWHCDWFANFVIAFRHGICHVPETLAVLRVTPSSYSAHGFAQPDAQRKVVSHFLTLLANREYQDVLPLFRQSGVLNYPWYVPHIIELYATSPAHRNCVTASLIDQVPSDQLASLLDHPHRAIRKSVARFLRNQSRAALPLHSVLDESLTLNGPARYLRSSAAKILRRITGPRFVNTLSAWLARSRKGAKAQRGT